MVKSKDAQSGQKTIVPQTVQHKLVRSSQNTFVGTWLILVYLITVLFSISVLGSYQIQSRIRAVEIDKTPISIWRLDEMSNFLIKLETDRQAIASDIGHLKMVRLARQNERRAQDRVYDKLFADFKKQIKAFEQELQAENPEFEFVYMNNPHTVTARKIYNWFKEDLERLTLTDSQKLKRSQLQSKVNSDMEVYAIIGKLREEVKTLDERITFRSQQLSNAEDAKNSGLAAMKGIDDSVADSHKLQNIVLEFHELKQMFWGVFYKLAIIPSELLVLFLVLAMGALGSTIFITQLFFNAKQNEFGLLFYLSRPFFGATIALSIFVLAKAGVLFLTDTQSGNAKPSLSPFFISFIAIISGLMSEQAILTIRRAGNRWLDSQNEGIARWGVKLNDTIKLKKKEPADFINTVDISMETMTSWMKQKNAIPFDMQEKLSAWLETKPRELFTDIPPDDQEEEGDASKMQRKFDSI